MGGMTYPAYYPAVVAVGAIDGSWQVMSRSSQGREVDVVAPGGEIMSTWPGNRFRRDSGTSMAASFMAGVLALTLAKHRAGNRTRITDVGSLLERLAETAIDLGPRGADVYHGHGLVHPLGLVRL